jgi:hypothetical protein
MEKKHYVESIHKDIQAANRWTQYSGRPSLSTHVIMSDSAVLHMPL